MSRGYSRIIVVGNLGGNPEMRYTPSGTPVTNFSIAVNRRRSTGGDFIDETDWYRVAVFGRQAEIADQYLVRGMKVLVDGRPSIRTYTGQDGVERTSVEINCDNFQMLNTRDESEAIRATAGDNSGSSTGAISGGNQGQSPSGDYDDFEDDDIDDVPF